VNGGPAAHLFTTYGAPSETFLRRELEAMRTLGVDVRVYSLWGGAGEGVTTVPLARMLTLFWRVPCELFLRPEPYRELFEHMLGADIPTWTNFGENWRGAGCAILLAGRMRREGVSRCHALWATMPAAAAWLLKRLTGIPYTMGAHAYDIYEGGGDWLLALKARDASLIHCSTWQAAARMAAIPGIDSRKIVVARRGLTKMPAPHPVRATRTPLRIASAGRFVAKKGFRAQVRLYGELARRGLDFEARIAGSGPLEDELRSCIACEGLEGRVTLAGWLDEAAMQGLRDWADLFLYTGTDAPNGDRDGLPNVVAEAMACGLPVVATPAGALREVLTPGNGGVILDIADTPGWMQALSRLAKDDAYYGTMGRDARLWAIREYDALKNARLLLERIEDTLRGQGESPLPTPEQ
jgi:glycosyltransferase involved in cell wall biosynthesis